MGSPSYSPKDCTARYTHRSDHGATTTKNRGAPRLGVSPRFTGEKRVNLPDSHGLQTHTHTHNHHITNTKINSHIKVCEYGYVHHSKTSLWYKTNVFKSGYMYIQSFTLSWSCNMSTNIIMTYSRTLWADWKIRIVMYNIVINYNESLCSYKAHYVWFHIHQGHCLPRVGIRWRRTAYGKEKTRS